MLLVNLEEERQVLVENLQGALKESGLRFQEWELREQELMRAAVTREQRSHRCRWGGCGQADSSRAPQIGQGPSPT